MPVHLYGQMRRHDPRRRDWPAATACDLVEDAAQAHGSTVDGRGAGTFGLGCFSFYAHQEPHHR